jgi:hypothetical protein
VGVGVGEDAPYTSPTLTLTHPPTLTHLKIKADTVKHIIEKSVSFGERLHICLSSYKNDLQYSSFANYKPRNKTVTEKIALVNKMKTFN